MDLIQMSVYYPGAGSVAAILLGVSGNKLRLAVDGWEDVGEFLLIDGEWYSEDGEPVEIDSMPDTPDREDLCWPVAQIYQASASVIWTN